MDNNDKTTEDGYNNLNRPLDNKHELITDIGPAKEDCPQFPFFGATYPDACCINGYLWDLDSHDSDLGGLTSGGEHPCPFCNTETFLQECRDNEQNMDDVKKWMEKIKKEYGNGRK